MLLPCLLFVISGDTLYHGVKVTSVRIAHRFQALHTVYIQFYYMFARSNTYFILQLLLYNHHCYLYFTISSPNQCTYTSDKCIGCVGDTRDFLYRNCRVV
jgi:hypothetical protein